MACRKKRGPMPHHIPCDHSELLSQPVSTSRVLNFHSHRSAKSPKRYWVSGLFVRFVVKDHSMIRTRAIIATSRGVVDIGLEQSLVETTVSEIVSMPAPRPGAAYRQEEMYFDSDLKIGCLLCDRQWLNLKVFATESYIYFLQYSPGNIWRRTCVYIEPELTTRFARNKTCSCRTTSAGTSTRSFRVTVRAHRDLTPLF